MTDALVAFVQARLDEDEQAAREAALAVGDTGYEKGSLVRAPAQHGDALVADGQHWASSYHQVVRSRSRGPQRTVAEAATFGGRVVAAHIARQDPARTLREVDAKRQLLDAALADRHYISADQYETCPRATAADGLDTGTLGALEDLNEERRQEYGVEPECWSSCGRDARVRRTLELLALPYSDHPGYEEARRP